MTATPSRSSPVPQEERGPDAAMRRLARGGALNLAGSVFAAAAQFALVVLVTRLADESVAGAYFTLGSIAVLVAAVPTFGAGTGLIYFLARYRALGRWDLVARTLRRALVPTGGAIVATMLVVVGLAGPIADLTGIGSVPGATSAVRVIAVAIGATAAVTLFTSATRGFGSNRVTVVHAQVIAPLLQLLLVGATATAGLAAMTAGWSIPLVIAAASCALATVAMFRRGRRRVAARVEPAEPVAPPASAAPAPERGFWSYTSPLGVVLVLKSVVQRIDVVLLSAVGSPAQVVLYVAASRYLVLGQLTNRAMNWTLQPRIAAALASGDRRGANDAYGAATAWLVLASWPIFIGCMLFPASLLQLIGGPGFRDGSAILVVLAASMLVAAACGNVEAVLAMAGRTRMNLAVAALTVVTNIVLLLLLIPRYGSLGAAYAWAAAILVSNVVPTVLLGRYERLTPFTAPLRVAAALSVASTLLVGGAIRLLGSDSLAWLAVAVLVCGLVHLAGAWRLRSRLGLAGLRRATA